jgi:hypothetical protein
MHLFIYICVVVSDLTVIALACFCSILLFKAIVRLFTSPNTAGLQFRNTRTRISFWFGDIGIYYVLIIIYEALSTILRNILKTLAV